MKLLACISLLVVLVQLALVQALSSPATPVFANNYRAKGVLSLPYGNINEPFEAWYDRDNNRSRTDYYGNLYKVYQFGPKSAPSESGRQYGSFYKLLYVPADFGTSKSFMRRVLNSAEDIVLHGHKQIGTTKTKRACFGVDGSIGNTVQAQTVLPNLVDFKYDSTGKCPMKSSLSHRHLKCELWTYVRMVDDRKNTYKMWIRRDEISGEPIPVYYYMLGHDSLLGSHYDRYDIVYHGYFANEATDDNFMLQPDQLQCSSMPGPGDDSTSAQIRSHMIVQNPITEFVVDPHRYDHIDHEFDKFAKTHERNYDNESHRKTGWFNFLHNFRFINSKNRELKHYKLAVNKYADNDLSDLSYLRGRFHSKGYNGGLDYENRHKLKERSKAEVADIPESWDWRMHGAVTPVKDQAVCGSCWSFGTSGAVEGAYFVKTGKLVKLSEQQMVDCSWQFGDNGCDGGEDFRAYQYIMKAGGLALSEEYGEYLGVDGRCHDDDVEKAVKISGFYNVTSNNVDALKHALITYGPITVAIDASRPTFTFYSHGVYYDDKCSSSPDSLDHQVLVVGYQMVDGELVWLVKNSWSTYWGKDGYILMSAKNNNCGVMDSPTVPIIAE